jgi:hypothetical protein
MVSLNKISGNILKFSILTALTLSTSVAFAKIAYVPSVIDEIETFTLTGRNFTSDENPLKVRLKISEKVTVDLQTKILDKSTFKVYSPSISEDIDGTLVIYGGETSIDKPLEFPIMVRDNLIFSDKLTDLTNNPDLNQSQAPASTANAAEMAEFKKQILDAIRVSESNIHTRLSEIEEKYQLQAGEAAQTKAALTKKEQEFLDELKAKYKQPGKMALVDSIDGEPTIVPVEKKAISILPIAHLNQASRSTVLSNLVTDEDNAALKPNLGGANKIKPKMKTDPNNEFLKKPTPSKMNIESSIETSALQNDFQRKNKLKSSKIYQNPFNKKEEKYKKKKKLATSSPYSRESLSKPKEYRSRFEEKYVAHANLDIKQSYVDTHGTKIDLGEIGLLSNGSVIIRNDFVTNYGFDRIINGKPGQRILLVCRHGDFKIIGLSASGGNIRLGELIPSGSYLKLQNGDSLELVNVSNNPVANSWVPTGFFDN